MVCRVDRMMKTILMHTPPTHGCKKRESITRTHALERGEGEAAVEGIVDEEDGREHQGDGGEPHPYHAQAAGGDVAVGGGDGLGEDVEGEGQEEEGDEGPAQALLWVLMWMNGVDGYG